MEISLRHVRRGFGKASVVRKIHSGLNAAVFLMSDETVVRIVGIGEGYDKAKAVVPDGEPVSREEFEREVRITRRAARMFNGKTGNVFRVPRVYDAKIITTPEDGREYGVVHMELVVGQPMKDALHDTRTTLEHRQWLATRWGATLAVLHGFGISHGDYHATNVIVEDRTNTLILLDWTRAHTRSGYTADMWKTLMDYDVIQAGQDLIYYGLFRYMPFFRHAYVGLATTQGFRTDETVPSLEEMGSDTLFKKYFDIVMRMGRRLRGVPRGLGSIRSAPPTKKRGRSVPTGRRKSSKRKARRGSERPHRLIGV